jgi:hypothetical protein
VVAVALITIMKRADGFIVNISTIVLSIMATYNSTWDGQGI